MAVSVTDDEVPNFGVTGKFEWLLGRVCAETAATGTCVQGRTANTKNPSQITL